MSAYMYMTLSFWLLQFLAKGQAYHTSLIQSARNTMAGQVPRMMRKIVVTRLGSNFSQVTKLTEAPVPFPGPGEVLVHNK